MVNLDESQDLTLSLEEFAKYVDKYTVKRFIIDSVNQPHVNMWGSMLLSICFENVKTLITHRMLVFSNLAHGNNDRVTVREVTGVHVIKKANEGFATIDIRCTNDCGGHSIRVLADFL